MQCNVAGQLVVGGAPYGPDSFEQQLELFPPRDSCQIPLLPEPRYAPSLSKLPGGKFVVCGGRIHGTAEGQTFRGRDFTDCVSWTAGETTWSTAFTMRLLTILLTSQVPQPLLLVVGWVYNAPKTVKFFFDTFHSFHLVTHWKKVIEIG